jgi:hypothetical protein
VNFDKVIVLTAEGGETLLSPAEFMAIPLGVRIELMTASRIKFFRDGLQISPLEAVRRPT